MIILCIDEHPRPMRTYERIDSGWLGISRHEFLAQRHKEIKLELPSTLPSVVFSGFALPQDG